MNHEEAMEAPGCPGRIRARLRGDRGAVGTEMAIVVAIVVTIALALGVVMRDSAEAHQGCIPATPQAGPVAGCP